MSSYTKKNYEISTIRQNSITINLFFTPLKQASVSNIIHNTPCQVFQQIFRTPPRKTGKPRHNPKQELKLWIEKLIFGKPCAK